MMTEKPELNNWITTGNFMQIGAMLADSPVEHRRGIYMGDLRRLNGLGKTT